MHNTLGIAVGTQAYKAYRDLLDSDRLQRLENLGARPQRLLFASTGTKDKKASDTLYIAASPRRTRSTRCRKRRCWPSATTAAAACRRCRATAATAEACWRRTQGRHRPDGAGAQLQSDGAKGFVKSWHELLGAIEAKSKVLV